MNPWTIIGWTLIAGVLLIAAGRLWNYLSGFVELVQILIVSIKTPPEEGQEWILNGELRFVITDVSDSEISGRVETLQGRGATWKTITADEWRAMVSTARAVLVQE